jgi:hypothetical protein
MNCKPKQVAERASKVGKSHFRGSSSSSNMREALLRCVYSEVADHLIVLRRSDEEENERREEENENDESEEEHESGEEDEDESEEGAMSMSSSLLGGRL